MTKLSEEEKAAAKQRARERFLELGWDRRGPPMTKLEQVARAMYEADPMAGPGSSYLPNLFLPMARAAVEALREPTVLCVSPDKYGHYSVAEAKAFWKATIDAILSEKPE